MRRFVLVVVVATACWSSTANRHEEKLKAEQRIRQGTPKTRYYQDWVMARGDKTLGP
jgi:hypothetical protein